jgi:hypothetical protein
MVKIYSLFTNVKKLLMFRRESSLGSRVELSNFLASVERRAFKQAMFAIRNEETALDIVQDAMMRLRKSMETGRARSGRCCFSVSCKTPFATAIGDPRCDPFG